ncbi:MAG: hypothetical protein EAZ53_05050 [Bacteroidetes bacterium]|nr:MAG: hypothetical protein EAZ53_05050 [Bacteroidota bacterium]
MASFCIAASQIAFGQIQPPPTLALQPQPTFQPAGMPLWNITGQVRTRTEFRDGLGNPAYVGAAPNIFTSQRTNLNIGYRWDKLLFGLDLRDVRVWGQDAATINNADGNKFFLHQAWGEFIIASAADTNCKLKIDNLSLKVGRQELIYDDSRLLGNLDWLQQGRRHDMALLKMMHRGYQADFGVAFNQNNDNFGNYGTTYVPANTPATAAAGTIPVNASNAGSVGTSWLGPLGTNGAQNMYKSMMMLYLSKKFNQTKISVLALNDNFQKYSITGVNVAANTAVRNYGNFPGRENGNGVHSRFTAGFQISTQFGNSTEGWKTFINGGAYYQFGKSPQSRANGTSQNVEASHIFGYATFSKDKWSFGPGFDILSGNKQSKPDSYDHRFDPLYGTPHRWWGYMDYFYVGTGGPAAGLQNFYLKGKYTHKSFFVSLDAHAFFSQNSMKYVSKTGALTETKTGVMNLGTEFDLICNVHVNKFVNLEAGYSVFLSTEATEFAKNGTPGVRAWNGSRSTDSFNQWGYLMINIRPDFLFQKPVAIKN